jgi:hypothetical protein
VLIFSHWQISWDQHASHQVLSSWAERALQDEHVSGIGNGLNYTRSGMKNLMTQSSLDSLRQDFVKERLNEVDRMFGRTLGCRMSPELKGYVNSDNHLLRKGKMT